jgi:outer membrane protein assembly factor BamB
MGGVRSEAPSAQLSGSIVDLVQTKTRLVGAVLAGTALLTTTTTPALAAPVSAWTHDGYGPGNTGYNPYESALNLGTIADLRLSWTATPAPGEEGCTNAPGPPLVAAGRVILAEGGGVGARDVRTGKRLWLRPGFSLLGPRMAIAGGLLYVSASSCHSQSNYEGTITALDPATGAVSWQARQNGTVDKLVVDAGVLVTHGYCHVCDEDRDQVVAYRAGTGARLWSRDHADLAGEVVADRRVLLSSTSGAFGTQAVRLADGVVGWRSRLAWQALSASPLGDRFLASSGTGFSAVAARTGKVAWSVRSTVRSLSTDGRRVFASGAALTAYDAATGRRSWTRALVEPGKPIRAGGLLYVTHGGPAPAILAPVTGRVVASGSRYRAATGHLVVAAGRLFTTDGTAIRAYAR